LWQSGALRSGTKATRPSLAAIDRSVDRKTDPSADALFAAPFHHWVRKRKPPTGREGGKEMANAVLTKVRLTMVAVALALSVVVGGTVVVDDAQARGKCTMCEGL
jgi:hypothetical protein